MPNTLGYDPLLKLPDNSKSIHTSTAKNQMILGYAEEIKVELVAATSLTYLVLGWSLCDGDGYGKLCASIKCS